MSLMRAAVLANFSEVASRLGLNPDGQLRAVGLSRAMIASPDRLISSDAAVRLLENAAAASGCDTFGLRMAEPRPMSQFGVVGLLLAQQRCLRDVMQMVIRYLPLINESLAITLEFQGDRGLLREEILTDAALPKCQTADLAMAANVKIFRSVLGQDWRPSGIYFRHPAPRSLDEHWRVFGAPCHFDSDMNAMAFPERDMDCPNPNADSRMAEYALGFIEALRDGSANSVATAVRRQIYLLLPLGRATIKEAARSMGCSVRKLQLDLDKVGASFGRLLEDARKERACLYMDNPHFDLGHVASLLGYNHQSSFSRWFALTFGTSPAAWRKSRADQPTGPGETSGRTSPDS
jgi:AraC-like DNA-binding protein